MLLAHGYSSKLKCRCGEPEVRAYLQKISGPILDRIDLIALFTEVPDPQAIEAKDPDTLLREVEASRQFARSRFGALPSRLTPQLLEGQIRKKPAMEKILQSLTSLRSRHKVLRVACSIQSLEQSEHLREEHLLESRSYRFMDQWAVG